MKKSNILLLIGFLTVLLLITAIHITLFAKYKSGEYTLYNAEDELTSQSMQSFPNILFVSVRNVPGAMVKFSDVAQVEKGEEEEYIQYVQKGDTLQITGPDSAGQQDMKYPVTLNLPSNATISVFNSSLTFRAGKKAAVNNPVFYLQKSEVIFSGIEPTNRFGHLKLVASDSSKAAFYGSTEVNHLEMQLSNSSVEYGKGNIGQLSIVTDSLSRLSLPSKHFLKANIKTIDTQ